MHMFENSQFEIKYEQEIFVKLNKRIDEGFKILQTQSGFDRTIKFNSNSVSKLIYGFLADCYLCLISDKIRKERGNYNCFLNCIINYFKIENFNFSEERLRNICKLRKRNMKVVKSKDESFEEKELKATINNLKKLTNTIDFSLLFLRDLRQFNLLKTQLDEMLIIYKKTLSSKIINLVPTIDNIENAMLIMTNYVTFLETDFNFGSDDEKFYKVVNKIFGHYNIALPCPLVNSVNGASNGVYKESLPF